MTDALGTLTPTSMTVVATRICVCPEAKSCICVSLSLGFILPCTIETLKLGNLSHIYLNPFSRSIRSDFLFSSMSG